MKAKKKKQFYLRFVIINEKMRIVMKIMRIKISKRKQREKAQREKKRSKEITSRRVL